MFRLLVLFAVNILSGEVKSTPRQLVDVDSILDLIRSQDNELENASNENTFLYRSENIKDVKRLLNNNKYSLHNNNIMRQRSYINTDEILQEIDKRSKRDPDEPNTSRYYEDRSKETDNEISDELTADTGGVDQNKYFNDKALSDLLSRNVLSNKGYSKSKLTPSTLVGSSELQSGYSKIYVILNPYAIEKSKNQEELDNLLSRVLSLTGKSNKLEKKKMQNHYKGFPLKKGFISRRLRRDSREIYSGKDSMENDYKPKRMRNDHGGVGGAGGRTAIPYIRNRGDIYERDH